MDDCEQCEWIFDKKGNFYLWQSNHMIIYSNNSLAVKTIIYDGWYYCQQCGSYISNECIKHKYPETIYNTLKLYLIKDVVKYILMFYHYI
jgi:hypothetical protein